MAYPTLLAHADWGLHPQKRCLVRATQQANGRYLAHVPEPVDQAETLLRRLNADAGPAGSVLVGFDFPLGLPAPYADRVGLNDFLIFLLQLGRGGWPDFFRVAERPEEISLHRPFYPQRPGGAKQQHLLDGLGFQTMDDLRRQCDLSRPDRRAAAPLFWTLGGQQVGKAALNGWRTVIIPALRASDIDVAIWPFSGPLFDLFQAGRVIIAETYPAECYRHLGVTFPRRSGQKSGKRVQASRKANAPALLAWTEIAQVDLDPALRNLIFDGFGPGPAGEDPFDATIGLFGMLNVLLKRRPPGPPDEAIMHPIEGWNLGQN